MPRAKQQPLFVVPTVDSRFTRETLRRGGPYEVQGKRWRGRQKRVDETIDAAIEAALPTLKKMP